MTVDMNDITRRLYHWLGKHNIPRDGVRVTIEFPTQEGWYRAEAAIKIETEPYLAHYVTRGTLGDIQQMNGIGLTLKCR